jgi:putative phosphoribosyl transferase
MNVLFPDRAAAGRLLAAEVVKTAPPHPVVYALPRGGVPVALEIAKALRAPLDLMLVRKIGVPRYPELAAGSIVDGERPDLILNEDVMTAAGLTQADLTPIARRELEEIERRRAEYMPGQSPISAEGKTAILVDDGIATGASMRAAVAAIRRRKPLRIIVAAAVASPDTVRELGALVDDVIVLLAPVWFRGVGQFYEDFHQLEDSEVVALLGEARAMTARRDARDSAV